MTEASTDPISFKFMNVLVRPMAWSDNIAIFGNSVREAAKLLRVIAEQFESRHLAIKDDFFAIVCSHIGIRQSALVEVPIQSYSWLFGSFRGH